MNLTCVERDKALADDEQGLASCSCDLNDQNLAPCEALDSPEPVINPKPAPHFDKSKQIPTRFVFCKNYDQCLDFSIARCWDSFSCEECSHYEVEKSSPQKWLEDNLRCLDLIDTLEEMRR